MDLLVSSLVHSQKHKTNEAQLSAKGTYNVACNVTTSDKHNKSFFHSYYAAASCCQGSDFEYLCTYPYISLYFTGYKTQYLMFVISVDHT